MPRAKGSRTRTRYPGVYALASGGYEYVWRDAGGRQKSGRAKTLDRARKAKEKAEDLADRGHAHDTSLTFEEYARDWVERYQGRTNRGFRESTRESYRRELEHHVLPFFGERQTIATITPRRVSSLVAHLVAKPARPVNRDLQARAARKAAAAGERPPAPTPQPTLTDASIRRIMAPLKACLADAVQEGVIASNPAAGVRLPSRPRIVDEDDDDQAATKALTDAELAAVIQCSPSAHRLLIRLLAATGLRISEGIALAKRNLVLSGDRPHVKVRRAWVKGEFHPPKSKHGRRDVPLPDDLVRELRAHVRDLAAGDLVFAGPDGPAGDPWNVSALRRRSIELAAAEAGVSWAGFHTLRHTCATRLFASGRNAVQVSRWLGHHSAAFTLERYIHLLNEDLGGPIDLPGDSMGTATPRDATGHGDPTDPRILSL